MRRAALRIDDGRAPDASIRQIASARLVGSVVEWYDLETFRRDLRGHETSTAAPEAERVAGARR